MDYEKAYKELIEKIELISHSALTVEQHQIINTILTELAGSEDEQIRKELTKHLKEGVEGYMPAGDSSDYRRWLDWLEKQGKSSDQIHYWTEEEIEPIISDYLRGAEHYGGMIGRLRCLKPKSLEKQGESYTKRDVDNAYIEGMASAKRELEKQAQKPAWSEEDNVMMYKLLAVVELYYDRDGDDLDKQSCIDWLKSLKDRYTWKPSDEQMATLYKYAEQNNYDGSILTSLYNELKKLREE